MAAIRASWRRVVQTAPYESETLELALEQEPTTATPLDEVAELSRALSAIGDQLLAERLGKRTPPPQRKPEAPDNPW